MPASFDSAQGSEREQAERRSELGPEPRPGAQRAPQPEQRPSGQQSARKRRWPFAVLVLAVLLLASAVLLTVLRPAVPDDGMEPNVVVGSMEGYTQEDLAALMADKVEEGMISFSLNTQMVLDGPDGEARILFENPANNAKLLKMTLTRDDTGEQLYATGYVAPGSYVDSSTFDVRLEPGSYTCTALIESFREDSKQFIGQVAAEVAVTVKNPS